MSEPRLIIGAPVLLCIEPVAVTAGKTAAGGVDQAAVGGLNDVAEERSDGGETGADDG